MSQAEPAPARRADSDPDLLEEAADWVATLNYGRPTEADRLAFEAWRRCSPAHDRAWREVCTVLQAFSPVPAGTGRQTLAAMDRRRRRRRLLRDLSVLTVAVPAVWLASRELPWPRWTADLATGIGEQRRVVLPDGSEVVLDTASAVDLDFSADARRLCLRQGKVMVTAVTDPTEAARPFIVETGEAVLTTRQARFVVEDARDRAAEAVVLDREVRISPREGPARVVTAPASARFDRSAVDASRPLQRDAALWAQGLLLAIDQPLGEVLAALARYRPGVLRWDPAVAQVRVSGSIALTDTDASLDLLARSLPIRVVRRTRYWVTVLPLSG